MADGETFGTYRIERLLGRGGMGEVYRAYDESQKRMVALKLLSPHLAADESYRARFRRESELAARLREAHVIPIHRYGEIEGRLFLDMRLVEGSDLAAVLEEQGALPPDRAVAIVSQIARALDAAHADGLIHRDVKPSNVLVSNRDEDSDDDFVYLVDFGIARAAETDGPGLTKTGAALGSFDYMAPERFLEGTVDRRTDVYSLSCMLYECLVGQRPFTGEGLPALMYGHLNLMPARPSKLVSGLPSALDDVIAHGMAKLPEERFARAGDLAAAARRALRTAPYTSPVADHPVPSAPATEYFGPGYSPARSVDVGSGRQPPPTPPAAGLPRPTPPATRMPPPIPPTAPPGPVPDPNVGFSVPGALSGPIAGLAVSPVFAPSPPGKKNQFTKGRAVGVLAVVTALVLATIFAVVLTRADAPPTTAAGDSAETIDTQTVPTDPAPLQQLLDLVPADFNTGSCVRTENTGFAVTLDCGSSRTPGGPSGSTFHLSRESIPVDDIFVRDMEGFGLSELPQINCTPNAGYFAYPETGSRVGFASCLLGGDISFIYWTQRESSLYGVVTSVGGEAGLSALWEWWKANAAVPP